MKTDAKAGQPVGALTCCGRPMKCVEPGIRECTRCDCYVTSDGDLIETVGRCGSH